MYHLIPGYRSVTREGRRVHFHLSTPCLVSKDQLPFISMKSAMDVEGKPGAEQQQNLGTEKWVIKKEKEDVLGSGEMASWFSGYTLGHSGMRTRTTV